MAAYDYYVYNKNGQSVLKSGSAAGTLTVSELLAQSRNTYGITALSATAGGEAMSSSAKISSWPTVGDRQVAYDATPVETVSSFYLDGTQYNLGGGTEWGNITGTLSNQTDLNTALSGKANDNEVVKLTGNQTVAGTKTFSTSPVVPSKSSAAGNNATTIATEAQVYKKQDTLVSGTNIKTVNGNSLLGSGDIEISAGKEYTAGEGIEIKDSDYSAMQGPAPDGFHIPLGSEWNAVKAIWRALGGGAQDGTNFGIALKLPFAGYRGFSSASVSGQGSSGSYWSSSRDNASKANILTLTSTMLDSQNIYNRAGGLPVRCFKDNPVIPTSSWSKLYGTSIEAGGIFWSSADGLISLSSDGQTWITIADKNLGATTVWNSGDALSEANCGKYYQRGNNYGFPRASDATITTSSVQVDASNYGPGNYYSSDTFITYSGRWDTTDNGNLWGGVTGVVTYNNAITNTGVLSVNGQTGDVTISIPDYSRQTKTISSGSVEIGLRTIVDTPASNFTLTAPATLKDGEEYVLRTISGATAYTITLGTGFTNPRNVNLTLSANATDQFVFLAIGGELELQPLVATGS